MRPESLHIKKITVDAAPTAKRIRFQSMGRAFRYRKRHCHLTVMLEGETDVVPTGRTGALKQKKKRSPSPPDTDEKKAKSKITAAEKTTDEAAARAEEEE